MTALESLNDVRLHFKAKDAYICADPECDTITVERDACPSCMSTSLIPLSRIVNRPIGGQ